MDDIFAKLSKAYIDSAKTDRIGPQSRSDYDPLFEKYGKEFGVDPDLLRAMTKQESSFNPRAVSSKNAQGLMQLIPDTAKRFGVKDPFDPDQNIRGGAQYMRWLLDRFKGDVDKALAGYNAGEGAVDKYKGIPPFRETQDYVKRIRGTYRGSGLLGRQSKAFNPASDDPFAMLSQAYLTSPEGAPRPLVAPPPSFPGVSEQPEPQGGSMMFRGESTPVVPPPTLPGQQPMQAPQMPNFPQMPSPTQISGDIVRQPVTETLQTVERQAVSAVDAQSPRAAVLFTDPAQAAGVDPSVMRALRPVQTPQGVLYVNEAKAKRLGITDYARDMAKLIGKVEDVGTDAAQGTAVVTLDKDGNELTSSIVTSPFAAARQAQIDKASFPDAAEQRIVGAQDVVAKRSEDAASEIQTLIGGMMPTLPQPDVRPDGPMTMEQAEQVNAGFLGSDEPEMPDAEPLKQTPDQAYAEYADFARSQNMLVMTREQFDAETKATEGKGQAQASQYGIEAPKDPAQEEYKRKVAEYDRNVADYNRKRAEWQKQQPERGQSTVSFGREVGKATGGEDFNRTAGTYGFDPKRTDRFNISQEAITAVGSRYGITPAQVAEYVRTMTPRQREIIERWNLSQGKVTVPFSVLAEIKGDDAIREDIRMEEARGRADSSVGINLEADKDWVKADAEWLNSNAGAALVGINPLFAFLDKDQRDKIGASAVGGVIGSGSRAWRSLAGIARPINTDIYEYMQRIASPGESLERQTGDDGWTSTLVKIAAGAPGDLSRLYLMTRIPGRFVGPGASAIIGFAADSGLQSSGRGDSPTEILKQTGKGAALGAVFAAAPIIGRLTGEFPVAVAGLSRGAQVVGREVGTTAAVGLGSGLVETAFGSSDEQALQTAIVNSLFHLATRGVQLRDKIIRGRDNKGNEINVGVDKDGNVRLLKGEVKKPDGEVYVDMTAGKDGVYRAAGDTSPIRAKETTSVGNRGNRIGAENPPPRELSANNPQRIETPNPTAVQNAKVDTRARKIADYLVGKDFVTKAEIAKATRINLANAEEAIMTLYGAKLVEFLPGNRVRLIDSASYQKDTDLFEQAQTYGQELSTEVSQPSAPVAPGKNVPAPSGEGGNAPQIAPQGRQADVSTPQPTPAPEFTPTQVSEAATAQGISTSQKSPEQVRREEGRFTQDGVEYVRQEPMKMPERGKTAETIFADREPPITTRFAVVDDAFIQPAHLNKSPNPQHFIPEAQPNKRTDDVSAASAGDIAQKFDVSRDVFASNPYFGPPVINTRGEAIQGNKRSEAIKGRPDAIVEQNRQWLIANAESLGIDPEEVKTTKRPALVRVADVDDDTAIRLGQYTTDDVQAGGRKSFADPLRVSALIPQEVKAKILGDVMLGSDENATLTDLVRNNTTAIARQLKPYLSPDEYQTIFGEGGRLTPKAAENLKEIFQGVLYAGGSTELPKKFEDLPDAAQKGITQSLPAIFSVPESASLVPEIQNAVIAANHFLESESPSFTTWASQADMLKGGMAPSEIYLPVEIEIAKKLLGIEPDPNNPSREIRRPVTQKSVKGVFADYATLINGREADMFSEATPGVSKPEAIRELFGVDYEPRTEPERAAAEPQQQAERRDADAAAERDREPETAAEPRREESIDRPSGARADGETRTTAEADRRPESELGRPRTVEELSPAERSAVRRDLAPKSQQGRGRLAAQVAEAYNLDRSSIDKLAPLGEVGKFGQTSHIIKASLAGLEHTDAFNSLARIFLPEVGPMSDDDLFAADRLALGTAILDEIAAEMGRDRSSQMDADDWGRFLDRYEDALSDDAIDVILTALEHQSLWHQNILKFTEDPELDVPNRRVFEIGQQFGWEQLANARWGAITTEQFDESSPSYDLKNDNILKKEVLRIGRKYGIKESKGQGGLADDYIKRAYLRAIQRTAEEQLRGRTDTRDTRAEAPRDTPTRATTPADARPRNEEELANPVRRGGQTKPGRVVTVNDQTVTLTPEQEVRWVEEVDKPLAAAKADLDRAKKSGRPSAIETAERMSRATGMRVAAVKREITGQLTAIEKQTKAKRETSNFIGKEVSVAGRDATVIGNSFGRVKVEFADGTEATVPANQVKARSVAAKPKGEAATKQPILTTTDISDIADAVDVDSAKVRANIDRYGIDGSKITDANQFESVVDRLLNEAISEAYHGGDVSLSVDRSLDPDDLAGAMGFDEAAFKKELDGIKVERDEQGRLLAPNGKPSNLPNELLWKTVRTESFKRWFGDWLNDPENASKVVDENGEPRIVYHGTAKKFDSFDLTVKPLTETLESGKQGIFFTPDKGFAEGYAESATDYFNYKGEPHDGMQVVAAYLSLQNPLEIDVSDETDSPVIWFDSQPVSWWQEEVVDKGYDGAIIKGVEDPLYIASRPNQIKSIFNRGSFSPDDANILLNQTNLFGEPIDIPASQQTLFDTAEVKAAAEAAKRNSLEEMLGRETYRFLDGMRRSPDRRAAKAAELIAAAANYASNKSAESVIENAADGLDLYARAVQTKTPLEDMLRQQWIDPSVNVSEEAKEFAQAVESNVLGKLLNSRLSDANRVLLQADTGENPLVVAHNLSEANLLFTDKLGALAMPSLAITSTNTSFTGFGEITLLGDKSLIDPKRKVPVTDADMYSPRYPSQVVLVKHNALKDIWTEAVETYTEAFPDENKPFSHYVVEAELADRGVEGLSREPAFQVLYFSKNGIAIPKTRNDLYDAVKKHRDKIDDWASEVIDSVGGEYKFRKGYTNSGKRRHGDYTLEAVIKHIKSEMKNGEGWNYGAGSIRATAAKRFKSIAEIQKDRHRIVSREALEATKAQMQDRLFQIADRAKQFYKYDTNRFGYYDDFSEALADGIRSKKLQRTLEEYGWEGVDMQPIIDYIDTLRNQPTEYFEAKPQRAVYLREFTTAVVPNDISDKARRVLTRAGLEIVEYKRSDTQDRTRAVREASSRSDLLFDASEDRAIRREYEKIRANPVAAIPKAKYEFNPMNGVTELNIEGLWVMNKAFKELDLANTGFRGAYVPKRAARRLLDFFGAVPQFKAVEKALRESVESSEYGDITFAYVDTRFPVSTETTIQEETAHRADLRTQADLGEGFDRTRYENIPAYQKAAGNLVGRYAEPAIHREVLGKIRRDDAAKELGITEAEAEELRDIRDDELASLGISAATYNERYARISKNTQRRSSRYAQQATGRTTGSRTSERKPEAGDDDRPVFEDERGSRQGRREARSSDLAGTRSRPVSDGLRRTSLRAADRGQDETGLITPAEAKYIRIKTKGGHDLARELTDTVLLARLGADENRTRDLILDVLSAPKSAKSSLDLSAAGRQGWITGVAHPILAARAFRRQLPVIMPSTGAKSYQAFKQWLNLHPYIELAEESGLFLATLAEESSITEREETFMSRLLGDDPYFRNKKAETARKAITFHVRASERAFKTYLDHLRIETFEQFAKQLHQINVRKGRPDDIRQYEGLAKFINYATGRGDLGMFNSAAPYLNAGFFSARFWASRLQVMNPLFYAKLPPGARSIVLKDAMRFVGGVAAILLLLDAAGADIEWDDPNNPAAFKIGFGKYKYQVDANLMKHLRYVWQMAKGERNRTYLTERYVRGTLAPVPAAIWNTSEGKNVIGEPTSWKEEAFGLFTPITASNYKEAMELDGTGGLLRMMPETVGFGTGRYKDSDEIMREMQKEVDLLQTVTTKAEQDEQRRRIKIWQALRRRALKYEAEDRKKKQNE